MTTFLKECLKTYAVVIASGAKQSHFRREIASSPAAPRNDSGHPVWRRALRTQGRKTLLAGVAFSVLLTLPSPSAEQRLCSFSRWSLTGTAVKIES